ncbi:MAG: PDZ domain-containing protein, partial [Actinomycetota bacterium]|nr:PDZ domain-containing protein [Actinomycetota bacterium]
RGILLGAGLLVLLSLTAFVSFSVGRAQSSEVIDEARKEDRAALSLYAEALAAVREGYVGREGLRPEDQAYGAIEGMLATLGDDGHTRFLTPEERRLTYEGLSGSYVGVGVQLKEEDGSVVVASPIEGSPADEAGLEPGDVIRSMDGRDVSGRSLDGVVAALKGPEGTEVAVSVGRDGARAGSREFVLERAEIDAPVAT